VIGLAAGAEAGATGRSAARAGEAANPVNAAAPTAQQNSQARRIPGPKIGSDDLFLSKFKL
jgi:hypothetical protein